MAQAMLTDLVPVLTLLLLVGAQPRPCTREEEMAAEESTHLARRSWGELHDLYVKYAKRATCDDGAVAEGWSDAVGHLLADRWKELPKLSRLTDSEPDFLRFIVRHVDLTIPAAERDRIRASAKAACPRELDRLCEAILLALDRGDAEIALDKRAPGVVWRSVLELDVDGNGLLDFVLLGRTSSEAVLGVVFGASRRSPVVLRFRSDAASQGGICGNPADTRIAVENLAAPDDPDDGPPAEARAATGSHRKGFRLDSDDCDAFHFFFDGKEVTWWRR